MFEDSQSSQVSSSDTSDQSYDSYKGLKYTPIIQAKILQAKQLISQLNQLQNNKIESILANPYLLPMMPIFTPTINYYFQIPKWQSCYNFCSQANQNLESMVLKLEKNISQIQQKMDMCKWIPKFSNKTKKRRMAVQIDKKFKCPYNNCFKFYGSDVSLNLHIKIKHNGGNKSDRQKLAQQICQAQANGLSPPRITIVFPPGYLDSYCASYKQKSKKDQKIY